MRESNLGKSNASDLRRIRIYVLILYTVMILDTEPIF